MINNQIIDLKLLRHFVVIAETLSYTEAANVLKVTKSKLSKDIAKLEGELGSKVFDRSSRVVRLSEAGKILYSRALVLLEDSNHLFNDIKTLNSSVSGKLNLAAPPALGRVLSNYLLPNFLAAWPQVSLSLKLSYEYENLFKEGLDLAFRMGKNQHENLIQRQIGKANRVLVASPDYIKSHIIQGVEDLKSCKSVQFFESTQSTWTLQNRTKTEYASVPAAFQCADFVAVLNCVKNHLGIAQLPWFLVRDAIKSGELVHVLPDWVSPSLPIYMVYRQGFNKPNKLAEFLNYIDEHKTMFDLEFKGLSET
ncbi:MAG: LysR substrate-binding domain-containing protein [Aliiglaciecola sp.]|uniref:LysR family transcriptional regulator n=1 Tax=Aliiglaciecola sp. TaxID=1872441 RepID=UPI003298DDE1